MQVGDCVSWYRSKFLGDALQFPLPFDVSDYGRESDRQEENLHLYTVQFILYSTATRLYTAMKIHIAL